MLQGLLHVLMCAVATKFLHLRLSEDVHIQCHVWSLVRVQGVRAVAGGDLRGLSTPLVLE